MVKSRRSRFLTDSAFGNRVFISRKSRSKSTSFGKVNLNSRNFYQQIYYICRVPLTECTVLFRSEYVNICNLVIVVCDIMYYYDHGLTSYTVLERDIGNFEILIWLNTTRLFEMPANQREGYFSGKRSHQ